MAFIEGCLCILIPFVSLLLIESFIFFLICLLGYSSEDILIEAIKQEWKKYPILDLSIIPKEGYKELTLCNLENIDTFCECSHVPKFRCKFNRECNEYEILSGCNGYRAKKASKIYNTTLYVKYYEFDYLTLFNRLDPSYDGTICKDEYERCGYLDIFNHTLCLERKGICPINNDIQFSLGKDRTIDKIKMENERKDIPIMTYLYALDKNSATIFDINNLILSPDSYKDPDYSIEYYFSLNELKGYPYISKSEFFIDNQLIIGEIPSWFLGKQMHLYFSKYPGNLMDYPLNQVYIFIFQKPFRWVLKFLIFFSHCFIAGSICAMLSNGKLRKLYAIVNIIYLPLIILDIIFLKAKYNISRILYYYENNIFFSGEISGKGLFSFIFQIIIEAVPQIILFIFYTIINTSEITKIEW